MSYPFSRGVFVELERMQFAYSVKEKESLRYLHSLQKIRGIVDSQVYPTASHNLDEIAAELKNVGV